MASNNRKMFFPDQPGQSYTHTFFIPFSQIYPPPPPPPPPPQRDLSILLSTSICIIGSVLLFLFLTFFLYLYIMKSRQTSPASVAPVNTTRRENENEERDFSNDHHVWRITTPGLHRSVIDSITVVRFKKGEWVVDGTDCSVCLSEFEEEEELRVLPKCSHAFHISCIDTWLLSHKNCPLCRSPVVSPTSKKTESVSTRSVEEESSGSRNGNVVILLPRSQSDLARHCGGSRRLESVRRSFSIGGSSLVKAESSRSRRQYYSSFSANFFSSSSRRLRNQDSVLPTRMPHASG